MTDSPEANPVDQTIPLLLNFVNSENYRVLKTHEKKEFDKIIRFMHEQIKKEQQGKSVDPQKFHQDLTKKLNYFNRVIEYDIEQQLANAGLVKQRKISPKIQAEEKLRKLKVRGAVVGIVQNLPKPAYTAPKRVSRPRRIIDNVVRRALGKSPRLRDKNNNNPPLVFRSELDKDNSQTPRKLLYDFLTNTHLKGLGIDANVASSLQFTMGHMADKIFTPKNAYEQYTILVDYIDKLKQDLPNQKSKDVQKTEKTILALDSIVATVKSLTISYLGDPHFELNFPQQELQNEFGKYAEQLIKYTNKKYGEVSSVFSEHLPTEQEKQQYQFPSLAKQSGVRAGDFIERAHHYPEEPNSRDQLVIKAMHKYEDKHKEDNSNELMNLSHSISGVNSMRTKIDKIYNLLKETPPRKDLIDQLMLNISLIKPEAEILTKDLNKINNPEIKKIANEVIKLADKLTDSLPKDIRHNIEVQQAREQQVMAPHKKP